MRQYRSTLRRADAATTADVDESITDALVAHAQIQVRADVDWTVNEELEILDKDWKVVCHATVLMAAAPGVWVLEGKA